MTDTEFIAACEAECFARPWSIEDIAAAVTGEYGVCAVSEGIGYAIGRISFDEAELYRIAVLPDKRRSHHGSELLRKFIDICSSRGVRKIFLEVRARNVPAIGLYERHEFERISVRKGYYPDDDGIVFMLDIDKKQG